MLDRENPDYEISSLGNIRRKSTKVLLHPYLKGRKDSKYLYYHFWNNDTHSMKHMTFSIHKLVATAFIPNPENKPQVNHINGIKTDNRVENLEWVTASENVNHAIRTGLAKYGFGQEARAAKNDVKIVHEVCKMLEQNIPQSEIKKKLGINKALIISIKYNNAWPEISSQYNIPPSGKYTYKTSEQIKIIDDLISQGVRKKSIILKAANLESNKTNKSYIKYRIKLFNKNHKNEEECTELVQRLSKADSNSLLDPIDEEDIEEMFYYGFELEKQVE